MQVNTSFGASGTPDVPPARPNVRQPGPSGDEASFSSINNLKSALAQVPDVRADKVAQAKSLLEDPSYPNNAVLGRVAHALTRIMSPEPANE